MERKKEEGLRHVKVIRSGGFRVDMNKYLALRRSKVAEDRAESQGRKDDSAAKGQS